MPNGHLGSVGTVEAVVPTGPLLPRLLLPSMRASDRPFSVPRVRPFSPPNFHVERALSPRFAMLSRNPESVCSAARVLTDVGDSTRQR
jgi:hypothetical protein